MNQFTKQITSCVEILNAGGLILYPTDTIWGLGCDATNTKAVERVYRLKRRSDSKALICLVAHVPMLEQYVTNVPPSAYDIIDYAKKPTTIIYDLPRGLAPNLVAPDGTVGIRVASDKFCRQLITAFKKPLVSTSANLSGDTTPVNFQDIDERMIQGVDYVVNVKQSGSKEPSVIIKLGNDGSVKVIRA